MDTIKIHDYIACELHKEIGELERRIAALDAAGAGRSSCLSYKMKELYWTVTRLVGLGHLHEGRTPQELTIANSRRDPQLFPAGARLPLDGVTAEPGQRLLIDVTDTVRCSFVSGIQRVVRQLAKATMESGAGIPVFVQDGELFSYVRQSSRPDRIEVAKGDKFVMADAAWNDVAGSRKAMETTSRNGGSNIVILHDIHPLLYPGLFHPDNVRNFAIWFDEVASKCDALVAVSKSAAQEFSSYVAANGKRVNPRMRIGWQHLGADFDIESNEAPSEPIGAICAGETPLFLSVSTLEPKKGYAVALDAFDRLWERGVDVRYVIVGRHGWNTRALERRILSHREYDKRLFWVGQVSAVDLGHLYKNAHSLIFASVAEGFGLPLVEAAHFGLPAIASDIPVFREVGGDSVSYFDVTDGESLARRIRESLAYRRSAEKLPRVRRWREATDDLLKLIRTNAYQFGSDAPPLRASLAQDVSERPSVTRAA